MSGTISSALIFAAGFGTRMGVLTKHRPKPMLTVHGRPMIDHTVDLLQEAGVTRIVANTHYLHSEIAPHLDALGVQISHEQQEILDTGGGLRRAADHLGSGPVITINPDAAWRGPNPAKVLMESWQPGMGALLLVVSEANAIERKAPGDFSLSEGLLTRKGNFVYTGAQIIDPALTLQVPESAFSLNVVWDQLIIKNRLHGVVYNGDWCDIGHPEGLVAAENLLRRDNV